MKKIKRKKKLVNKKFQLKTFFNVLGISAITFILILGILAFSISRNTNKINNSLKDLEQTIKLKDNNMTSFIQQSKNISSRARDFQHATDTEKNIVDAFIEYTKKNKSERINIAANTKLMHKDHQKSIQQLEKYVSSLNIFVNELDVAVQSVEKANTNSENVINNYIVLLKNFVKENKLIILIIVLLCVIQGFFLYIYLIRATFRISGPIYVLSKHLEDIIDNKKPQMRELRKKDELMDFYKKFKDMIEKINQQTDYFNQPKNI
jgi:cell division protein FtsL